MKPWNMGKQDALALLRVLYIFHVSHQAFFNNKKFYINKKSLYNDWRREIQGKKYNECRKLQIIEGQHSSNDIHENKELTNANFILSTESVRGSNDLLFLSFQMFHMTHNGTTFETLFFLFEKKVIKLLFFYNIKSSNGYHRAIQSLHCCNMCP